MRTFVLLREEDVSGSSGVGVVAEVVEFSTGKAVMAWQVPYFSVEVHDTIESVERIHGHAGKTRLIPTTMPLHSPDVST